ncbi:hemerythrin domain-containing protein [Nocardioidaceae bacterium]|nr:hemerythrin domain-containing protein [Nocardioidaceae bacterium]
MTTTNSTDLGRPTDGNVIDLILADHRRFEDLLRDLRGDKDGRRAALDAFATLHVAHAHAEESEVYPVVKKKDGVDADEAEHGTEEHAEGNEALLKVMELDALEGEDFEEAAEHLGEMINHHLGEEEINILTPARESMAADRMAELGKAFCDKRNQIIDEGVDIDRVRSIVNKAEDKGLLD